MDYSILELERNLRHIELQTQRIMALSESNSRLLIDREKLNKERIAFMTDFAHEIKSPLTIIQQVLESCEEFAKGEDKKSVKQSRFALKRIRNLIQDIMEWSRLTMIEGMMKKDPVDLVVLSKRIVKNIKLADNNKHKFKFNCEEKVLTAGDEKYLEVAIKNIIENACKYSPEGKDVNISIFENGNQIKIRVVDRGMGFSKKEANMIFERFYRGLKARQNRTEGSGLGLAMTKEIIELHNGTIITNSQIKKGSEFVISLPKFIQ